MSIVKAIDAQSLELCCQAMYLYAVEEFVTTSFCLLSKILLAEYGKISSARNPTLIFSYILANKSLFELFELPWPPIHNELSTCEVKGPLKFLSCD